MSRTCLFRSERFTQGIRGNNTLPGSTSFHSGVAEAPVYLVRFSEALCGGTPSAVMTRASRISRSSRTLVPCRAKNSIQNAKQWLYMTNSSEHGPKMTSDTSIPHGINVRLGFAPDMLWIGGVIYDNTGHTVRKFGDPGCHKMVNVIRNRPNGDGFVSIQ